MNIFKSKEIVLALLVWACGIVFISLFQSCSNSPVDPIIVTPPVNEEVEETDRFQSLELSSPWENQNYQIVIDAYRLNSIDWDKMATDKRVTAVIHKSSEGLSVDSKYSERRAKAEAMGYLWGAYHLGTRVDVKKQADLFLSLVDEKTLIVLDLEDTTSSRFMSLSQAIEFLEYVYSKTGRVAVIYANHHTTKLLNQKYPNHPLLKKSMLWYARFKSNVTDFPKGIWDGYFLWQFSSEINCSRTGSCLYNVLGTRYDMDVNIFPGSFTELKSTWYK
tara:strand:+ start:2848 stop:3675 length:828 start_codon:yes stop_codon:yes gene_type:complete